MISYVTMSLALIYCLKNMFTDSHSHMFDEKDFPDVEELFARCREAKVDRQVLIGCTAKESLHAVSFVKKHAGEKLWATLGVHPHYANEVNSELIQKFKELAADPANKVVGIGEIGLDYFRNMQPKDVQFHAFRMQLRLARELRLPVVIHVRDAWDDALMVLKEEGNTDVVLHCFSGDMAQAEISWKRGYLTSFTAVITYPKNVELRSIVAAAPRDKYMIETDCPYLPPQHLRGKRNEPAYVVETAKKIAEVRAMSIEAVAQETTDNAIRFFRLGE
jgi:TatD DNase family protein